MMERADIAIIGTGPAGISAAITAKVRGKTVLLFGSRELSSKLTKAYAEQIGADFYAKDAKASADYAKQIFG